MSRRINIQQDFTTDEEEYENPGVGHNSRSRVGNVSAEQLRSIVERIEKLEEEKADIAAHIRDVFYEAKGNGFDIKSIRQIIKLRKKDAAEREEEETILEVYKRALGMTPTWEEDGRED